MQNSAAIEFTPIGKVMITATITDTQTSGVGTSHLYLDDTLRADGDATISYLLDEPLLGRHTITIETYDNAGNMATVEQKILTFNL